MEQKYQQFSDFDWSDQRWQTYLSGLYPPPSYKQVLKFKKKWYKRHIDPEFDETYEPGVASSSGGSANSNGQGADASRTNADDGQKLAAMGPKAVVCIIAYAVGLGLAVGAAAGLVDATVSMGLLTGGFVMEILGKHGFKFSSEYLHAVIQDDVGIMPFMTAVLIMPGIHKAFRMLAIMPIGLAALVSLAMLCKYSNRAPGLVVRTLAPLAEVSARYQLIQLRSDSEVMLGVALIVGAIMRLCAPLSTVLYWNVLTMRYALSPWTQASFRKIDSVLSPVLSRIPGISSLYTKLKAALHSFAVPGEGGGSLASRCTIL